MSDFKRGLKPLDPAKHARFQTAAYYGFTWPTVVYPVDVTGGVANLGMGGNGPDPTLTANGGQPCGDCGPNIAPKNVNTVTAALLGMTSFVAMTSNQITALYFTYQAELAGIAWRPEGDDWVAPDGLDVGVDLGDWLLWLFHKGYIDGFVKLNLTEIEAAAQTTKCPVVVGVYLNPQADNQFPFNWDVGPGDEPDPNDGHAIGFGYALSPSGPFKWASWGGWVTSTLAWRQQCPQQAFAVLTEEQAHAIGFPIALLASDLKGLGGMANTPAPAPAPVDPPQPQPEPEPVPEPVNPIPAPAPAPPSPEPVPGFWSRLIAWLRNTLHL